MSGGTETDQRVRPFQTIKSYDSFEKYFADAVSVRIVSYCMSPKKLLELFKEYDLQRLEVLVGQKIDLQDKVSSPEVVDELEQRKEADDLVLYVSPDHDLHTKLYIIETQDGSFRILNGSPNFTVNGWDNHYQKNSVDVFEVSADSAWYEQAIKTYEEHLEYCEERFLDDLTEELEASDDSRKEVIKRWVATEDPESDEVREVHASFTEQLGTMGPEIEADEEIHESLRPYEDQTRDRIADEFSTVNAVITNQQVQTQVRDYGRAVETNYDVPKMWVSNDAVHFLTPDGEPRLLTEDLPDPDRIDAALANVESYFETIETHAHCDDTTAAKAHFFEALLYFFWAPFANQYASVFSGGSASGLGKALRFLYIHGEPNAGKGTFVEFALRLLSENTVTRPEDASRVYKRTIEAARRPMTSFPFVVDDIERDKFRQLGILRNYWDDWNGEIFPPLVFTSNDNKPPDWFMERAKMVQFQLKFTGTLEATVEARELLEQDNPLFRWFSRVYLDQEVRISELQDEQGERDDMLAPARLACLQLYQEADRELPPYFPERPAEWEYDVGREQWQEGYENNHFAFKRRDGVLVARFGDEFQGYEIDTHYLQNLPRHIRADRMGRTVQVKSVEPFERWFSDEIETNAGYLSRLRSRLAAN